MRRQRIRAALAALLATCALTPACGDGGGPDDDIRLLPPDETPNPVLGRSIDVTTYDDGERMTREPVVIGSDDPRLTAILGYLEEICEREAHIQERFEDTVVELAAEYVEARDDGCGRQGAAQQQRLLCIGHQLMGMSESVMPQDFVAEGERVELRARRLVEEIPEARPTPLLTIPVQDNASRATLAMWAELAFQRAAMAGAKLVDPEACVDGSMAMTLPPYEPEGERVPLAFVVASATTEAMHQMMDAAARAQQEIRAQAAELRSRAADPSRGVERAFREPHGSLLEAASVVARIPSRLMNGRTSAALGSEGQVGELSICGAPSFAPPYQHAVELFRHFAVNPAASARITNLRAAMVADDPEIYATAELEALSDSAFFARSGTDLDSLASAADFLETEIAATRRVATPFMRNGTERVRGLTPRTSSTPAAFDFARTAGSARVDQPLGERMAPTVDFGGMRVTDILAPADPDAYGSGPALEALDVVASALANGRARGDMQRLTEGRYADERRFAEAVELADAGRLFARTHVPMRVQNCVGKPVDESSVDRIRIRLFGADVEEAGELSVWLGEAGLQCATTGTVEGEPCDPDAHRAIGRLEFLHSTIGHAAECAASVSRAASFSGLAGGGIGAAAATCAGGIAQTIIEGQIVALEGDILDERAKQILIEAVQRMLDAADRMSDGEAAYRAAIGNINSMLARITELRRQAMVQLSKVLVYEEGAVGEGEYPVNSVMRTRLATTRIRYERALRNGRRLAWLAKRAIEQRFGVVLEDMTGDLSLVEAPRTWARRVCSMGGIDYPQIRGELEGPIEDYADEFLGDYVDKLELFAESYRIDYPSENGADVAVVSVRDDLLRANEACDVTAYNQLFDSAAMVSGWRPACEAGKRCSFVARAGQGPFRERVDAFGNPEPRPLGMADAILVGSGCLEADVAAGQCNAAAGEPVSQARVLEGHYLLSWYEPIEMVDDCEATCCTGSECDAACLDSCVDACSSVHPVIDSMTSAPHEPLVELSVWGEPSAAPVVVGTPSFQPASDPWLDSCRWRRVVVELEVPERQRVHIGFERPVDPLDLTQVTLPPFPMAAPQLEELTEAESLASVPARRYFPTDEDRVMTMAQCPDLDGDEFRSLQHWRRDCEQLCPEGFEESCADGTVDRGRTRCFWETRFHVSQDAIDRGDLFPNGGFASGNFNYRHRTLGVNLVGVGLRDCAAADNPGACYASGSVPYSLRHDGPYLVRNYDGEDVEAPLYVGHIQHARGLTAERYLTNPLSAADRGLMADYWRDEFRGRPIAGSYTLRIYDAPGLQWQNLEDVQLVLDYGYWTRFE